MRPRLVPSWRRAWRMYSVWVIVLLSCVGSTSDLVDEIRAYFELGMWQTLLLGVVVTGAAVASRLLAQKQVPGDE